jgi:hypothetical protein
VVQAVVLVHQVQAKVLAVLAVLVVEPWLVLVLLVIPQQV